MRTRLTICLTALCLLLFFGSAFGESAGKRVMVFGFDGMDYKLMKVMLKQKGILPNFKKLMKMGSFSKLRSTNPPQSPVAWSTFITGMNPGKHGIFDFISRDPQTYSPQFSMSKITGSQENWNIFGWVIPISTPSVKLLRKGIPFWKVLEENGVEATVVNIPVNFPPVPGKTKSISGMGTPDMLGTYGIFSFYTSGEVEKENLHGGKKIHVTVFDGQVEAHIQGPENSLKEGNPRIDIPFSVYIDKESKAAKIVVQDTQIILKEKEWSSWVLLDFHMAPMNTAKGMVRFYLKEITPTFGLYMSPINIDPMAPPFPISTPEDYSVELAKETGNPAFTKNPEKKYLSMSFLILKRECFFATFQPLTF